MWKLIVVVALSYIGGILYRLGGIGKPWNTKYRDFGVPLVAALVYAFLGLPIGWSLLWSTLLLFGAMTTYWCKINKWFGLPTDTKYWFNWALTGLAYGLAYIPIAIEFGNWHTILCRSVLLTIFTSIYSEQVDDVEWEEWGRGAAVAMTICILAMY